MNGFRRGLMAATLAILAACTSMGFRDLPAEQIDDQYQLPESSFTEINGNNVHYLLEGKKDAPVLVLVHGFTGFWQINS